MNVFEIGKKVFSTVNACGLQMKQNAVRKTKKNLLGFSKQTYTIMVQFYREIIL